MKLCYHVHGVDHVAAPPDHWNLVQNLHWVPAVKDNEEKGFEHDESENELT